MMRLVVWCSLLALFGCDHSPAASSDPGAPDGPFAPGDPLRLTYSGTGLRTVPYDFTLPDSREVSWTTDPARIVYAYGNITKTGSGLPHGCAGDLPAAGGSREWELCDRNPLRADSGTSFEWPARRRDGSVLVVRRRFSPYSGFPYYSDIAIMSPDVGQPMTSVIQFPWHSTTNDALVQGIAYPQWIDDHHILALARMIRRGSATLIQTGLEVIVLVPTPGAPTITVIPGTLYASSVSLGATADTIYYTLGGDSLVFRRVLSSGVIDTVVDFGPRGIARDVRVANGRLVAVVGGDVSFGPDSTLGMSQRDLGGPLYAVRLATKEIQPLEDNLDRWLHPALAPDGSVVIAEQGADLWSIPLP